MLLPISTTLMALWFACLSTANSSFPFLDLAYILAQNREKLLIPLFVIRLESVDSLHPGLY